MLVLEILLHLISMVIGVAALASMGVAAKLVVSHVPISHFMLFGQDFSYAVRCCVILAVLGICMLIALLTVIVLQLIWYAFDLICMVADRRPIVLLHFVLIAAVVFGIMWSIRYVRGHQEELLQRILQY